MADEELEKLEGARQADFVQLFSLHQRDIKAYIRTLVPSDADADDVMQETSVILWAKFSQFEEDKDFRRWGCGVAHRVVLRFYEKTSNDKLWFNEEVLQLLAAERLNQQVEYWEDRRAALRECIASLDSRQRRYLELRYAKSVSVDSISREVGKPVSTMYRFFAKMRGRLFDCVTRRLKHA